MVKSLKFSSVIIGLLSLFAILFLVSSARAQEPQSAEQVTLSVSPVSVELDANPGQRIEGSFKIVSGADVTLELTTTPKNFTASGEEGGVDLTTDDTSYSLAKWITVSPQSVELPARSSQIFDYVIDVPADAEPGGHFGSVIVATEPVQVDTTGPAVSQEVGPLILVKIAGDTLQEASIVDFTTQDSLLENGPVIFSTRVENTGNVHFKPKGTIKIKDTFGREVTTIDLEEKNVLPSAIRKLTNDWNPTGFSFGLYTADLTLIYGLDNEIVTASTSFILFPYKTIVPATLVIVFVIYYVIKNRERISKATSVLKNG